MGIAELGNPAATVISRRNLLMVERAVVRI